MRQNRAIIKAVHDDNLEQFLRNLGIYENLITEKIKCKFCNEILTLDNLSSVFPDSGSIKLTCDQPGCINKLNNYLNEKGL